MQTAAEFAAAHGITPETLAQLAALLAPVRKADRTAECGCGCGNTTKSRFAIGHDSKLKSRLILAHRAGKPESTPLVPGVTDPLAIATALGWERYLTPDPKAAGKVDAKPAPAPTAKPARKVAERRPSPAELAARASEQADEAIRQRAERRAATPAPVAATA